MTSTRKAFWTTETIAILVAAGFVIYLIIGVWLTVTGVWHA